MKNFISEICSEFSEKSSIYYAIWWIFLNIYSDIKSKNYENCNINDVTRDLFWNFGHFLPNLSSHFISNMSFIITRQIIAPHNFIKFWILKFEFSFWKYLNRDRHSLWSIGSKSCGSCDMNHFRGALIYDHRKSLARKEIQ